MIDDLRGLQERAARAQPARHVERLGDWWLRHTDSPAWWTGTVLAHGAADRAELEGRIRAAERFYARRGTPPGFQLTPGVCAPDLDGMLADRGYARSAPRFLLTAPVPSASPGSAAHELRVRVDDEPAASWLAVRHEVSGADPRLEREMLSRIAAHRAYASVLDGSDVVAVGRAVLDTGWVGLFGMATLPGARGRGAGRAVVASLAGWARGQGADGLYLQVEGENVPARRLYERAGFTEAAGYHYRTHS